MRQKSMGIARRIGVTMLHPQRVFTRNVLNKLVGVVGAVVLLASMFIIPSLTLMPSIDASSSTWWNDNWNFRKLATIDHTKIFSDLASFPVLIDITDSNLNRSRADGYDIVFTDAGDPPTQLDHEIEFFDNNTGHLVAWVRIPLLSSTADTELYIYYGNQGASNQQNSAFVWDSNYVMVQHLEESSSARYDSTSSLNNGMAYGALKKSVVGKIDGADEFDGLDDYVSVPNSPSLGISGAFMIEGWFRSNQGLVQEASNWYGGVRKYRAYELGWQGFTDGWSTSIYSGGTRYYVDSRNAYMPQGEWHYVVGQYDGQNLTIFLDGQSIASASIGPRTIDKNANPFLIGRCVSQFWNGTVDEVRISNVARSRAWLLTSYNNQRDPSTFCVAGAEEIQGNAPLLAAESPPDGATGINTNPLLVAHATDPNGDSMTIVFKILDVFGKWEDIAKYDNVGDGVCSVLPKKMADLNTTYYWGVCASDGESWTNKTYSFTTTATVLSYKWMRSYFPIGFGEAGVLAADVDGNGMEEVVYASTSAVAVMNGTNGAIIWSVNDSKIGSYAKPQIADLDSDGNLEIVVPLQNPAGLLVLRGNDGSVYWRREDLGRELFSSPLVHDINGDGYPEVFVASTDVYNGLVNGTGRLTSLTHDGIVLHQTFSWRPCGGGLSIADTDHDGEFELYMGDRDMYLNSPGIGDNGYGRGVRSFWASNLTERWSRPEFILSSSIPVPADVNADGILEIVVGDLYGAVVVLNSTDGSIIRKTYGDLTKWPVHYQFSVYDVDRDGALEMMMADGSHAGSSQDVVVWDLVNWTEKRRLSVGPCFYGPQLADLTGDGIMEIIACTDSGIFIFDTTYNLIWNATGLEPTLNYAVVQDIDGDDYNELVVSSQSYRVYAFDTPARRPNPRPRSEVQFYSEYRLGVAEYVPPPGSPEPLIYSLSPANHSRNVPVSLSSLQFTLTDYQIDMMNASIATNPDVGFDRKVNVANGRYIVPVSNLQYSTTYVWSINVTDGTHWTNQTFTFATEPMFPWMSSSWKYRKAITIDHSKVISSLSSFPVLIDVTDANLANNLRTGGGIAFTDANGNQIPFEIELYDNTTGHLVAWVNVPYLSSSIDTRIYLYYDNSVAANQQNSALVWDSNFVMVQHLKENSSTRYDSTVNVNNGTAYGGIKKSITGKIDGTDEFDGVDDYITMPSSTSLNISGPFTIEGWFRSNRGLKQEANAWYGGTNKYGAYELGWQGWSDGWTISIYSRGTRFYVDSRNVYMPQGEWHYVVGQYDGQYLRIFFDGLLTISKYVGPVNIDNNKNALTIGRYGQSWNGTIDEVRISNVARTPDWILTSCNNQKNPSTFCAIGNEELIPESPIVFAPSPTDQATGIITSVQQLSFSIVDCQNEPMNYTVTTYPDIGSGSGTDVPSGICAVPVSNLQYSTTYVWSINVTDGTHWTNQTYIFTTYPSGTPTQDDPELKTSGGDLICTNQTTADPDYDSVTNLYHWYRNNVSTTNLLLPFNTQNTTNTRDYSGYGNDGAILRGASWTNNGKVGGAYVFDRGFIQIPGTSTLDGGGFWSEITVECWINLAMDQNTTRIVAKVPSYELGISGQNNTIFAGLWINQSTWETNGYTGKITYGTPLQKGKWYHIAFTYRSGVGLILYVNGHSVVSRVFTGNIQTSGSYPLYIGWFDYFKGMIDEVRIYPKCLSPQQIYQRYFETKDGSSSSSAIVQQETNVGETWKCLVTPNDSHQDGTSKFSNTLIIGSNNKPIAGNLRIDPIAPRTNDNLLGYYTYFDPDGDPENGTKILWYKNDILQPDLNNTLAVPAALTIKGEIWHFTIRPSDGKEYGNPITSPHVLIQNSPPTIDTYEPPETELTIDERESIQFTHTSSDVDNDALTYSWLLDGAVQSAEQNWTYLSNYDSAGTHNVTLVVSESSLTASQQWAVTINDVNRPPTIDSYEPQDTAPLINEGESIQFTHASSDPDNDTLTYSWLLNGTLQSNLQNWTYTTDYDSAGTQNITLTVSDGQLTASQQWTVTVLEPDIPHASNLAILPSNPYTTDDLVANYTYHDPDGDPENGSEICWYKNDELQPELTNASTVSYSLTTKGEVWYFTLRASDGKEYGIIQTSPPVLIQNSQPAIDSYEPPETELTIDEAESIQFAHTSSDEDNETLTYSWLLDGNMQSTEQNWTYITDYDSAGTHNITLEISDNELATSQHWTVIVLNVNRPPQTSNLTISPSDPYTTDDLVANYTYYDPDGDPENETEIRWYKNDILQPDLNNILTVPASLTTKGEIWHFTVRPFDGAEFGEIQTSPPISVQNSPPTIDSFTPQDTAITINEGENVPFTHNSSDPDNDDLAYSWQLNETQQSTQQNWTYTSTYETAGTHTITLSVSDGHLTASQQWTVIVLNVNQPPEASNLTISPSIPYETDDLVVNYTYYDPDDDPEYGTEIRWYKNGELQPALNDNLTVAADQTTMGETWYFTVKPKDGANFGTLQASANVTIHSPPSITSYYPQTDPSPISQGESLEFSITCEDPAGDNLTIKWYVNETLQDAWTGNTLFTYTADSRGRRIVKVVVSDGQDEVSHQWTFYVAP